MPNVNELLQKRAGLVEQGHAILEKAVEKEKRSMDAEENAQYDRIFAEIGELDKTIEKVNQQRALKRIDAEAEDRAREKGGSGRDKDDVMRAFRTFLKTNTYGSGKGAQELRALQADSDEGGGYTVAPQQFVAQLIKNVDDLLYFRTKATVMPVMGAESLGVPTLTANPADAEWTAEISSVPEDSSMKFGKRELRPKPLMKLLKVSRQLMNISALPIDQVIASRLAYINALPQEKTFMTGTGANQPLGIFTASNDGVPTTQDVSTDNTTTAFTADGLINCKFKLKSQYHASAEWYFHRDAVKMLSKLKDGEGRYLWQASIQQNQPDMLLGRPVNMSEYVPNTFTTGLYVGIFADLSHYWIAESMQMEIQRANELYAANNQIGFFVRSQLDGQPVLAEAFARVKLA